MLKYEIRVASWELKALKHELKFKSMSSNSWVTNINSRVQLHKLWVKIHELVFKLTSCELKSLSYEFRSTSSRIINSMKTQIKLMN